MNKRKNENTVWKKIHDLETLLQGTFIALQEIKETVKLQDEKVDLEKVKLLKDFDDKLFDIKDKLENIDDKISDILYEIENARLILDRIFGRTENDEDK